MNFSLMQFEVKPHAQYSFHNLPVDEYLKPEDGEFRRRRYHTGAINSKTLIWDPEPEHFEQSVRLNTYGGGIKRKFAPIECETRAYIATHLIQPSLVHLPEGQYKFSVHQIRIITDDLRVGKPAPEGLHQDGFDYIVVYCIATHNIVGGNSLLFDLKERVKSKMDQVLEPGQAMLFDDRKHMHYVSPIVPKIPGLGGYRDVFVATLKLIK